MVRPILQLEQPGCDVVVFLLGVVPAEKPDPSSIETINIQILILKQCMEKWEEVVV